MLQAIVFDYDGTLAPTSERQERWFKYYSTQNGKNWPFKTFPEFINFYNEHCALKGGVQNVYDALKLPCDMSNKEHPVWPAYEAFNQQNPQTLYTCIKEEIERIWKLGGLGRNHKRNRRIRLGINTTNSWKSIHADLEKGGILQYFDSFVTEEVLRQYHGANDPDSLKKPATISIALMLGLIDCEGAYTLHVGDTRNDLRASYKVMRLNPNHPETLITCGACYGYEGRELLEQGVQTPEGTAHFDYLIDKPEELSSLVWTLL